MTDSRSRDEAAVRQILDDRRKTLHAKDAEALTAHDAPDILSYDLAPPLMTTGPDLPSTRAWLATWDGPIDCEAHELSIETSDGIAMSTSLNRMRGTKTDGARVDLWFRATTGYRKVAGRWMVVHDHASVPFYMDGSGKAALDLKP
jgi:ketosteroid isomerase-like protein